MSRILTAVRAFVASPIATIGSGGKNSEPPGSIQIRNTATPTRMTARESAMSTLKTVLMARRSLGAKVVML
jgi:hypothetical protein